MFLKMPWSLSGASHWVFSECAIVSVVNVSNGNIAPHRGGNRCFEFTGWVGHGNVGNVN